MEWIGCADSFDMYRLQQKRAVRETVVAHLTVECDSVQLIYW